MDCALGHLHNISFSIGKQTGLKHGEINTLFVSAVIQASVRKSNEAYNFVDRDKLIEVFNFYIKEWELYERYLVPRPKTSLWKQQLVIDL